MRSTRSEARLEGRTRRAQSPEGSSSRAGTPSSSKRFFRYLIVGGFNTVFGYGLFAGLTYFLSTSIPFSYEVATLASSLISITFSYLSYKWLVFKTRGRYLQEWFRALSVYGGGILLNLVLLPPLVLALESVLTDKKGAPYLAGLILTGVQVLFSFLGHKKYTFSKGQTAH